VSISGHPLNSSFGADLRALRKARGLTLNDLSDTLSRSVGWMSQVERDISSPTIDELTKIAATLNVPVSMFFGQSAVAADEDGYVVRKDTRRRVRYDLEGLSEELLSPDLTDDFEMIRSIFAPGAKLADWKQRATQEVGYVIEGRFRVFIGDKQFDLNTGDSFRIRGERYRWENPFSERAILVWVIAPPVY